MPNSNIARFTITIDQNKKCLECGKGGATENGLCLNCTSKALEGKPMKTRVGQSISKKFRRNKWDY